MIESINIGMSGLAAFSRGLKVIANNTTNLNTPGFKSSSMQFSDAFYANQNATGQPPSQWGFGGSGVNGGATTMSFKAGELRQTGNALDVAVDGAGLFMLKHDDGQIKYTRAGQFTFSSEGVLKSPSGASVMGVQANGDLGEISIADANVLPGKATGSLRFSGNLSSTGAVQTVSGVRVLDSTGAEHLFNINLTNTNSTEPGSWKIELLDGLTSVGTGKLIFSAGKPTTATEKISLTYVPAGLASMPLTLDFSTDVTSYATGALSTLAFLSQDGYAPAELSSSTFDESGTLVMTYGNGQTVKGAQLALGRFDSVEGVGAAGDNEFEVLDDKVWHTGVAGGVFGSVQSGYVEISNVDLSQEFSDLVVMQRGYQASSQVVSTANEMLQELFSMKNR